MIDKHKIWALLGHFLKREKKWGFVSTSIFDIYCLDHCIEGFQKISLLKMHHHWNHMRCVGVQLIHYQGDPLGREKERREQNRSLGFFYECLTIAPVPLSSFCYQTVKRLENKEQTKMTNADCEMSIAPSCGTDNAVCYSFSSLMNAHFKGERKGSHSVWNITNWVKFKKKVNVPNMYMYTYSIFTCI